MSGSRSRAVAPWHDRRLLTLGAVAVVVTSGFALLVPVFPAYVTERDGSAADLGILNAAYALALFVTSPVWGAISDRVGRRAVLAVGPIGLGASYFAMAVAPTVELAIVLRFAGGVFAAASIPTSFAYVADTTHGHARARAMGFLSAAMGLAFVFSPVIGGALGDLGTALPFVGAGVCAFAGAVLVFVALPAAPPAPRRALDGRSRRARLAGDLGPLLPILAISFLVSSTDGSRPVAVAVYAADRLAAAPSDLGLLFGTIGLSFTLGQLVLAGTLAIQGVGMALGFAAIPAYISHTTASGQGVAMGWRSATQSAGQVVGPIIGGWLYELDQAWPAFAAAGLGLTAAVVGVLALRPLVVTAHEHPVPAPPVQEPVT